MQEPWKTNLIGQDRVSAVIFRGNKLLLMRRLKPGRTYWSFIGGSIEPGESRDEALIREVREESSLEVFQSEFLWTIDNKGRNEHHFLVTEFSGEPRLGGPELERDTPDNRHLLTWVTRDEFRAIDFFYPEAAKEKLLEIWPS